MQEEIFEKRPSMSIKELLRQAPEIREKADAAMRRDDADNVRKIWASLQAEVEAHFAEQIRAHSYVCHMADM